MTDPGAAGPGRLRVSWVVAAVCGLVVGAVLGWFAGQDDPTSSTDLPASEVDIGFLQDMSDHHAQAILMAAHQVRHGSDEQVRAMAFGIVTNQATERGEMAAMLADRGATAGSPDRMAMAWMGMAMPVSEMSGMVPAADLAELLGMRGAELDRRFLELMHDHHIGGVHMARHAAAEASDPRIVAMARRMARHQEAEIVDLALMLGRG